MKIPTIIILAIFVTNCAHTNLKYTAEDKDKFIDFLKTLKASGDFYTEESVKKAESYLPVLLSFTEEDLNRYKKIYKYDDVPYPFLALSGQLCCIEKINMKNINYFTKNFQSIPDSRIKLYWSILIITYAMPSDEIVLYLKEAMKNPEKVNFSKSGWTKDEWEKLKKKLESYNIPVD